jgi:hypothetical protein
MQPPNNKTLQYPLLGRIAVLDRLIDSAAITMLNTLVVIVKIIAFLAAVVSAAAAILGRLVFPGVWVSDVVAGLALLL